MARVQRGDVVSAVAKWAVVAIEERIDPAPPVETLYVDHDTLIEALALIGDAWESRLWYRFAAVMDYCANVDPAPFDLPAWIAGRCAWNRAISPRVLPESISAEP